MTVVSAKAIAVNLKLIEVRSQRLSRGGSSNFTVKCVNFGYAIEILVTVKVCSFESFFFWIYSKLEVLLRVFLSFYFVIIKFGKEIPL